MIFAPTPPNLPKGLQHDPNYTSDSRASVKEVAL